MTCCRALRLMVALSVPVVGCERSPVSPSTAGHPPNSAALRPIQVDDGVATVGLPMVGRAVRFDSRGPRVQLSPSAGSCQVGFRVLGGDPQVDRGLGRCSPDGQLSIDLPVGIPVEVVVTSDGHGRPPFGRRATVETEAGAGTSELAPMALAGTGSLTATLVDGAGEFRSTGAVDLQSVASAPVRLRQIGEVRSATGAHFAQLPAGTYELSGGPGVRPAGAQATSRRCEEVEVTVSGGRTWRWS